MENKILEDRGEFLALLLVTAAAPGRSAAGRGDAPPAATGTPPAGRSAAGARPPSHPPRPAEAPPHQPPSPCAPHARSDPPLRPAPPAVGGAAASSPSARRCREARGAGKKFAKLLGFFVAFLLFFFSLCLHPPVPAVSVAGEAAAGRGAERGRRPPAARRQV
ncbi:uncharacterized protein LOC135984988 [Caloenas nicobarica]|uniref:uncharacterized protein LOC135984988 n=1 Tax=Caloenas nicobarica TaxID=187106 RepID=UPI0032B7A2C1